MFFSAGQSNLHPANLRDAKGLLDGGVSYEDVTAESIHCVDHQLLLNWFRIHLSQVERVLPRLSVKVLAHNSPFLPEGPNGRIFIADYSWMQNLFYADTKNVLKVNGIVGLEDQFVELQE